MEDFRLIWHKPASHVELTCSLRKEWSAILHLGELTTQVLVLLQTCMFISIEIVSE
jgi:hypothetical protein